jgi:cytochrome c-type biogenesis protein CcmH/NrfG
MIIVVGKWKSKLIRLAAVVLILALFVAVVPMVSGIFYEKVPVFSGWMKDEQPSGNPMRVEKTQEEPNFNQTVDRFVVKMQNFYHEGKE